MENQENKDKEKEKEEGSKENFEGLDINAEELEQAAFRRVARGIKNNTQK